MLAALCSLLVLLAGGLAANPAWHGALHSHGDDRGSLPGHHHEDGIPDQDDEATCVVCAFAHQQVDTGGINPVTGPVTGRLERVGWPAPSTLLLELVWPEPSGRGPPAGV